MKVSHAVLLVLFAAPGSAVAQSDLPESARVTLPDSIAWRASGRGISSARLEGNPSIPDRPFTLALRLEDGAWIPPHWHPRDKRLYVLSGTVLLGFGRRVDETRAAALPPGSFALVPAEAPHYEGARGETVFILYGTGPLTTTFVEADR